LTIPTQIFYDKQGEEVYRHIGFLDKKSMVAKLEELLAL
jgi:thioredoxin 1